MSKRKARKSDYIPPVHEVVNKRDKPPARTKSTTGRANRTPGRDAKGRRIVEIKPPSFKRVLKRVPIYFVIILALQWFVLGMDAKTKELSDSVRALESARIAFVVTLAFIPFMYLMERFQYNAYLRRKARNEAGGG